MPERSYNIAVCRFPGQNQEHPDSSGWVISHMEKWLKDKRINRVIPLRRSDTPITMVRNLLVKKALAEGADYILMIDADMKPDCEPGAVSFWDSSWDFMMERREREEAHRANIVKKLEMVEPLLLSEEDEVDSVCFRQYPPATIAAPYCGPPPNECVYVMKWDVPEGDTPNPNYRLKMFERSEGARFKGIGEVAALATGLILYDARVFKRLPPPWFDYEFADPPFNTEKSCTEDIFQTRNASLIGMPQYCNWSSWAGHIKQKTVRKPAIVHTEFVPNTMADAIRKGIRGDRDVWIVPGPAST